MDNYLMGKKLYYGNDGRPYWVLSKYGQQDKVVEIIENLNEFAVEFIEKLKKKYFSDDLSACTSEYNFSKKCSKVYENFKYRSIYLLALRYQPDYLEENQPTSIYDTAWTLGKGEKIAICMRKQNDKESIIQDIILLKFVLIHEMTHIAADTLEHPPYFWKVFKFLLTEAKELQNYESPDFSSNNMNYCGMTVKYNPYYDDDIKLIDEYSDIK